MVQECFKRAILAAQACEAAGGRSNHACKPLEGPSGACGAAPANQHYFDLATGVHSAIAANAGARSAPAGLAYHGMFAAHDSARPG